MSKPKPKDVMIGAKWIKALLKWSIEENHFSTTIEDEQRYLLGKVERKIARERKKGEK